MPKISKIWAHEVLDSRATPTVEAVCVLDTGQFAISSVPSGASTGAHEALELRDEDPARYKGKGVLRAVNNVNNTIAPAIVGMDPTQQSAVDDKLIALDGTENKTKLGANAILSVSEAVAKAGALAMKQNLYSWIQALAKVLGLVTAYHVPTPLFNMINGGLHGAGNLDFQEFWVVPASSKSYVQSLQAGVEIYMTLGENLKRRGAIHSIGDEGGYAPNLFTNADALELFVESIKQTPYALGRDVFLGLDVAADSFYKNNEYAIRDKSAPMDELAFIEYYKELNNSYHLALLEDPLAQDAWEGWKKIRAALGDQVIIVGDDLLATNPKRVEKAITEMACNAVLIKPNQIGTVTETLKVIKMGHDAKWKIIVSHRSGETNDTFIADFAVGIGADYVKFGAPARGERVAKYNRLSDIDAQLTASQK